MDDAETAKAAGSGIAAFMLLCALATTLVNKEVLTRAELAALIDAALLHLEENQAIAGNPAAMQEARDRLQRLLGSL